MRLAELGGLELTGSAPSLILLGRVYEQRVRSAEQSRGADAVALRALSGS
jgi:hypothetical protein